MSERVIILFHFGLLETEISFTSPLDQSSPAVYSKAFCVIAKINYYFFYKMFQVGRHSGQRIGFIITQ